MHWNWHIKAIFSIVKYSNSIILYNFACADRNGMAVSRLLE